MIILLQYRLMIDINYAYFKIHFRFNIYDELLVDETGRSLLSHFPCTRCFILSLLNEVNWWSKPGKHDMWRYTTYVLAIFLTILFLIFFHWR